MRRFSTMASGASSSSAKVRARLAKPEVRDHDQVLDVLLAEVAGEQVDGGQLVDRDVEEALDLALVEVHRQEAVGAGDGHHVGDQAGRDRDARLVLLVRSAVAVVRDDGGDPAGAGPLEGVDHDQQLHDRLVDRPRGRLDQEDVLLAGVVDDPDEDVLVGELEDFGPAEVDPEVAADVPRQLRVGVPGVDVELVRCWQDCLRVCAIGSLGLPRRRARAGFLRGHCPPCHRVVPARPGRRRCRRPCRRR